MGPVRSVWGGHLTLWARRRGSTRGVVSQRSHTRRIGWRSMPCPALTVGGRRSLLVASGASAPRGDVRSASRPGRLRRSVPGQRAASTRRAAPGSHRIPGSLRAASRVLVPRGDVVCDASSIAGGEGGRQGARDHFSASYLSTAAFSLPRGRLSPDEETKEASQTTRLARRLTPLAARRSRHRKTQRWNIQEGEMQVRELARRADQGVLPVDRADKTLSLGRPYRVLPFPAYVGRLSRMA